MDRQKRVKDRRAPARARTAARKTRGLASIGPMPRRAHAPTLLATVLLTAAACEPNPVEDPATRGLFAVAPGVRSRAMPRCPERHPERNAYFGDLHVHTAASTDAWMFGVRVTADDAYRYGFGGPIVLPDADGRAAREVRIDRPLDFAAVTDHAEFLGEMRLCASDADALGTALCEVIRTGTGRAPRLALQIMSPRPFREDALCGEDGAACRAAASEVWRETIAAAERWNRPCERTTFVAYEYSSHRLGSNLHRNVIFRNEAVPRLPVSYHEARREWDLWALLREGCLETDSGCDVLAIPHNSNISNGRMFAVDFPGAADVGAQAARAELRMAVEPVVEIMQHKGDSECRNGLRGVLGGEDELCDFEKFADWSDRVHGREIQDDDCPDGALADWWPHLGPDCRSRLSYVRYAWTEGLAEEARIGVNPFKFGVVASTDTHNGLAGGVDERSFPGHLGSSDATVGRRVRFDASVAGNVANGPGGLAGVWAEANSRDAIFDALRRKEVFGTSGPRIRPRLHAGWTLPDDLCERPDRVARADAVGVPMGGDLPGDSAGRAPRFLALALADPGTAASPGTPLERLQIVKGWVDEDGGRHQAVYDVAGDPEGGATVDPATCEQRGPGAAELCAVWSDPDFDPARRAVYYLRAVENPSCRYNAWQCAGLEGAARPAACDDPRAPRILQERAWTSPIWYTPGSRRTAGRVSGRGGAARSGS